MNKRGSIIAFVGFGIVFVSLIVAISAVPSDVPQSDALLISSLFKEMFDDVSEPIQIMPGNIVYTSYSTSLSDVPLLWGIQIINYQYPDKLSISVSNIFDDSYGEFIQDDSILFNTLLIEQSDTLNFQIENIGTRTVDVHIRRLRSKLEDAGHLFIETVRNVGYRFRIH